MIQNHALLTASLGNKQPVESLLESFPEEAPAFWQEIKPEDLREGMEDIWIETYSVSKRPEYADTRTISEMGTITSVCLETGDPTNTYLDIQHRLNNDPKNADSIRPYAVHMETNSWIVNSKIYQRHIWVQLDKDVIPAMQLSGVQGYTLRIDNNRSQTHNTIIFNNIQTDKELDVVKALVAETDEDTAVYYLHPKPVKIMRQTEAIPPMPGEKPAPGEQPGDGSGKPEDDPNDEIPPMPGESRQSVDKDKKGPTVQLEDGWWGTGRGEN